MQHKKSPSLRFALPFVLGAIGVSCVTGCSHPDATQSHAEIKAAMGGNYSPSVAAQGRAYQQQEMAKQSAMVQSGGKGAARPNTTKSNP